MIPILYGSIYGAYVDDDNKVYVDDNGWVLVGPVEDRSDYDTLGVGALTDTISCIVTEVRNGKYELAMTYPITGIHYEHIREGSVIKVVPAKGKDEDLFRIYSITRPISGIVEILAEHISYQLSHIPVMPFTAVNCSAALVGIKSYSAETNPFTFWTDKSVTSTFTVSTPASCRSLLGGTSGSILDVYGGEWEWIKWTCKLHTNRGSDNGVQLRYGKNITDINQEENIANVITGICPFWKGNDDTVVTLSEGVVQSKRAGLYPYHRTVVHDFSSDFEDEPTEDELREAAEDYIEKNDIGVPEVSIDVSFVDLSTTDDYSDISLLESVNLCDTVTVLFDPLGIATKAKVTETNWDVLAERYTDIKLGTVRTNLASILSAKDKTTTEAIENSSSVLESEIEYVTNKITGVSGGYVVINRDANDEPYELLIMDTDDIDAATLVWRWNEEGFGVSNTGYDGTYETAMTADGHFVADFITAGTLDASQVTVSNLDADNIVSGTIDASVIDVTNIDADNITTGTLDASLIEAGSITLTQLTSGAQTTINSASANVHTIYYISNSATAPTAPTSWISSTSDTNNTWVAARPTYSASYPYCYFCVQSQTVGGTISCTSVVLERTTTVIDGSHITTGSIDAQYITTGVLADQSGNFSLNMSTGAIVMANATLTGGGIDITADSYNKAIITLDYGDYECVVSPYQIKYTDDGTLVSHSTTYGSTGASINDDWGSYTLQGSYSAGSLYVLRSDLGQVGLRTYPAPELEIRDENLVELCTLNADGLYFYNDSGLQILGIVPYANGTSAITITPRVVASW